MRTGEQQRERNECAIGFTDFQIKLIKSKKLTNRNYRKRMHVPRILLQIKNRVRLKTSKTEKDRKYECAQTHRHAGKQITTMFTKKSSHR